MNADAFLLQLLLRMARLLVVPNALPESSVPPELCFGSPAEP